MYQSQRFRYIIRLLILVPVVEIQTDNKVGDTCTSRDTQVDNKVADTCTSRCDSD